MTANEAVISTVKEAGLRYVTDRTKGIRRVEGPKGFRYVTPEGKTLTDPSELDRIHKLVIPPAYRDVWICPDPRGHLQAVGKDAAGRLQYRYHPKFRESKEETKFERLSSFGQALPEIRNRVRADLQLRGLPKEKVLAVVVYLLEHSLIRVGNEEYAKQNKTFGLTTMLTRHVNIHGEKIRFKFVGKSKIKHDIEIHDRRLARIIKKIQDLPGQELFHYLDDNNEVRSVSSSDVNQYLREIAGEEYSAKDFRTWWGTLLSLVELSGENGTCGTPKGTINLAMKTVSKQLGNTPSVCRKCYVHPVVFDTFLAGGLKEFGDLQAVNSEEESLLHGWEDRLLKLLKTSVHAHKYQKTQKNSSGREARSTKQKVA